MLSIVACDALPAFPSSSGCPSLGLLSQPKAFSGFFSRGASPSVERFREGFCTCAKGSGDSNNGSESGSDDRRGEKQTVDWDKAWSSFRKDRKKSFLSMFDMSKYVTRSPPNREYPLAEETDPFKRTERSTLKFWTDPKFTLTGFGVILGLFIYMVVIVGVPPSK